jgi:hypothetical protein
MMEWVTENLCIGPSALIKKIYEKYNIKVPYMRVYYDKVMAIDKIYGPWKDSFQLLYIFKAEVEKACLRSIVEIDKHTVQYKVRGKTMKNKKSFCFIACWKSFLVGCRPYLVVDLSLTTGSVRGHLGQRMRDTCP